MNVTFSLLELVNYLQTHKTRAYFFFLGCESFDLAVVQVVSLLARVCPFGATRGDMQGHAHLSQTVVSVALNQAE